MKVFFNTPTQISLLDITTMGDSVKVGDDTKLGMFDSGLKHSIALLLRHNVGIKISVFDDDGESVDKYSFGTIISIDKNTGKEKELITVQTKDEVITTGFAKKLGFNWELWMALRELWSNMLDEGGNVTVDGPEEGAKTVVMLEFNEDNDFWDIWENRHKYLFDESRFSDIYQVDRSKVAVKSECGTLKIFKQGILVYESDTPSNFWWNIKGGEIDERRILSNVHDVNTSIKSSILTTDNEDFLRLIVRSDFTWKDGDFLGGSYISWSSIGDTLFNLCHRVAEEQGDIKTYPWILEKVKRDKRCTLPGRRLARVEDSLWSYSQDVTVETATEDTRGTILDKIKSKYNFEWDVDISETSLTGGKCIADKFNDQILVDKSFDVNEDMAEFIVEFVDLTMKGNVISNLSSMLVELIKK